MLTLLEDLRLAREGALGNADAHAAYERVRAFIEANTPWLPPQQEGFGPWIEYKVGDPGPRVGDTVQVLLAKERAAQEFDKGISSAAWAENWNLGTNIVAYCVKLPEAP